ncbi:hypothetical protein PRZ48_004622 [Zasmidium cellare]|uniref:DNA-directed RNA polymerase subunit n=1 Tax=Zasmidium cellare TaxID=395010 RepID=A0ABR0EQG7_ZASCE|nr:hypothetical protein PRZ48_004622 [Zasmidium cellare]
MGKKNRTSKLVKPAQQSPFIQLTRSLYLTLSPCAYNFPLEGLCAEHISPHLLSYYPPLRGILLAYSNPRLSENPDDAIKAHSSEEVKTTMAQSIAEYAVSYVWLTCEFTIFRPVRGSTLEGDVNLQSESVLGLMCYNYFNAAIDREKLPSGWNWDGEKWVDGNGKDIQGRISFKVEDFEASGQDGITIMGNMKDG